MARLTETVKRYVVQRLACYDPPTQIAEGVKEEFGLVVSRQRVHEYDPNHGKPSKSLRALFHATRKAFEDGISSEPAAKRAVRIRRLARMAEKAEAKGNSVLAAALLEQIAKEVGDAFTNRRKLEHSGEVKTGASLDDLTDAELAQLAADLTRATGPQ